MALSVSSSAGIKPSSFDRGSDPLSDFIPRRSTNSDGLSDYTSHDMKGEMPGEDYSNNCKSDCREIVDQDGDLGVFQGSLIPCSFSASSQKFSGTSQLLFGEAVPAASSSLLSLASKVVALKNGFRQLSDFGRNYSHEKTLTATSSWYEVPSDLIYLLARSPVLDISDLVRFGAVCLLWQSVLRENHWFGCGRQLEALRMSPLYAPKLMLAQTDASDGTRDFLDVSTNQTFQLFLPEAQERRVCGLNDGWAITMGDDMRIHLLNLITRQQIELPSQLSFNDFGLEMTNDLLHSRPSARITLRGFINKAIIVGSPCTSGGCTVVAIVCPGDGSRVAVVRPGVDKSWMVLSVGYYLLGDIIHRDGILYGITIGFARFLFFWNMSRITGSSPQKMKRIPLALTIPRSLIQNETVYLIEVSDELVMVRRTRGWNPLKGYYTSRVFVYKVKFYDKIGEEIKDLGDYCLFLGNNTSTALSPVPSGFKRNTIYFTDDFFHGDDYGGRDLGVYSLDDGKYSQFYNDNLVKSFSPPTWVTFNPNRANTYL